MPQEDQPIANEPPFWYVRWLADEFHLSMKEAREWATREMEQARHMADETMEVKS